MKIIHSGAVLLFAAMASAPASATLWTTNYGTWDSGSGTYTGYLGRHGTITFDDWGYTGPMGANAGTFEIGGGFNASNLGQIQAVQTVAADWNTPDVPHDVIGDFGSQYGTFAPTPNANMDGNVNFYKWAYTTPTSNFNNMQIDKAGNYYIAKNDMSFGFYDNFAYRNEGTGTDPVTGTPPGGVTNIDTGINFQPYAISDAKGWCGSTMVSNPNGLEQMAGQVTFDFAFDAYLGDKVPGDVGAIVNTQIVRDFVMRSYGSYTVDIKNGTDPGYVDYNEAYYTGSAVANNTNPTTGLLDPAYKNKVSFLGGGVVPEGVWILDNGLNPDGTKNVTVVDEGTAGAVWHANSFAGYAFLLRADAARTLQWVNPEGHSNYVATTYVPVPAAAWLFGSGLLGLAGMARRRVKG